ncbi:MAG: RNA-guided endonuclease InsQ/TnpB family protein [Candidatus Hermodarchaeota archaeon]
MLRTLKLKIEITSKKAQVLDRMGYVATKLWNTANWERRDQWKKTGQIPNYVEQAGELKTNQWYKQLPSQTAQAVLEKLEQGFKSWYTKRKKDEKASPPGFSPKQTLSSMIFKKSAFQVQGKLIRLSLAKKLREELDYSDQYLWLPFKSYKEVEGQPRVLELKNIKGRWVGYLVTNIEAPQNPIKVQTKTLAIDQGIINLVVGITTEGETLIYSGKGLLSIQRYFNKEIAKTQHRIQSRTKGHAWNAGLSAYYHKRGCQTLQALHVLTNDLIQFCQDRQIQAIVLGKLTHIRKNKDQGDKGNQKLHAWSFAQFAQLLTSKAEAVGILVETVSERNSSECCSTCGKKGSRCKRGLFKCTNKQCSEYNKPVNADLNGARNILNRYLRLGLTARKVLVGSLAIPMIKRWNYHTWDSHKWQLRNRVSLSLRNQRPGNIPLVESSAM